eukprot:scaffold7936_cov116-Isochrysis_galbana.AAC.9
MSHPRFFTSILSMDTAEYRIRSADTDYDAQNYGQRPAPLLRERGVQQALPLRDDASAAAYSRRPRSLSSLDSQQLDLSLSLTFLDALLLDMYAEKDLTYMRFTWPDYHYKHACRLGMCPNFLDERAPDMHGLSTTLVAFHRCSACYDPTLKNPYKYPSRTTAQMWAQLKNRDPSVERVGPCIRPRCPTDCWHNPEKTPRPTNRS